MIAHTKIRNIERAIHDFNKWINNIQDELKCDEEQAYTALCAVLQILRDRLTSAEATHLGAQLPLIIKGIYYDKWKIKDKPEPIDKMTFTSRVHAQFNNNPEINPTNIILSVFRTIKKQITPGELEDVKSNLPDEIKQLFNF